MPDQLDPDRLLRRPEVEAIFGITKRYLEVAAQRDDGPPLIKISRMVYYRVGDIRDWISAHRITPGSSSRLSG